MNAPALAPPPVGIEGLLVRLERVHRSGQGFRTDCPCGHRTHGTLSVTQADDGRILLHCFCGCSAADVLGALGLSLADIMPERLRDESPEARRAARERFMLASARAAAGVILREGQIVLLAGADVNRGLTLDGADADRLVLAIERIQSAVEALR